MYKLKCFIPLLAMALTILILGCANFRSLQQKKGGMHTGSPNYLWVTLISLLVGLVTCWLMCSGMMEGKMEALY